MALKLDTRKLQIIDRLIGVPLCASLTLVRRLIGDRFVPEKVEVPGKVLFVKLAEQGSTVLAYPAISRAIQVVGRENVFFLVFEENRFILDAMGIIPHENVITIRHKQPLELAWQALRALMRVRRERLDAAVDLEFFSRGSAVLTFLSGARQRVGFHTFFGDGPYRGDLMTHRLSYNPYLHTSQIFLLMVAALEQPVPRSGKLSIPVPQIEKWVPDFAPAASEQEQVRSLLQRETGNDGEPQIVLLNPNASDLLPLRKWPADRYVSLARRLLDAFPEIYIGLTGAPDEAGPIEAMVQEIGSPRCFSLAGKTTLRQLLVLYTLSELLITNDSGPAHFAAMTQVHTLTLFGPETPALFGARTPRAITIWQGLACSPCVNAYNNRQSSCTNNVCMQKITVDRVFDEASKVYLARSTKHEILR
ncbi:MAG: glycosyltransferase family 9 protein [Verrucomicrobia bacterium]|nr:glycosyltransferase family 9 protein [Verrucomicrobiota bacterium]MBV8484592.1 glycosyltransferase family 9 protein [Verrucomicrobiota bacterium]